MESRFGYDFSEVRIHTDERAAKSAEALNALSYTSGHHIIFGRGQYLRSSKKGQKLLAHELAHVVQQQNLEKYSVQRQIAEGAVVIGGGLAAGAAAAAAMVLIIAAVVAALAYGIYQGIRALMSKIKELISSVITVSAAIESELIAKNPGKCQEEVEKFRKARDDFLEALISPGTFGAIIAVRRYTIFKVAVNAVLRCFGQPPWFRD
jgi:hypothetical protein